MRIYILVLMISVISWADDISDSLIVCSTDSTISDSIPTKSDSLHVGRISHQFNSRSSDEGHPFDWLVDFNGNYKYNDWWSPDFVLELTTEREDGDRYNGYIVGHATDYYFIRDRVDEEHSLYLFEYGIYHSFLDIKYGFSYMWWSNTRMERHAIYHRYEGKWINAEIQYLKKIYKTEVELFYEYKWDIGSDIIFLNINGKYLKILDTRVIWSIGYKLGYEW